MLQLFTRYNTVRFTLFERSVLRWVTVCLRDPFYGGLRYYHASTITTTINSIASFYLVYCERTIRLPRKIDIHLSGKSGLWKNNIMLHMCEQPRFIYEIWRDNTVMFHINIDAIFSHVGFKLKIRDWLIPSQPLLYWLPRKLISILRGNPFYGKTTLCCIMCQQLRLSTRFDEITKCFTLTSMLFLVM